MQTEASMINQKKDGGTLIPNSKSKSNFFIQKTVTSKIYSYLNMSKTICMKRKKLIKKAI